jgi:hypothetical protein
MIDAGERREDDPLPGAPITPTIDAIWPWLNNLLVVGGPSAVAALAATAGLWKGLGPKWIEQRLGIGLEKLKAAQQKELEGFKSEQQKEMERLWHFLSSRISWIHEKEFEVLPKAWLMLKSS